MQNQTPSPKPTDAEQPAGKGLDETPCSASWFVNGAEYRERDGWIEARNHLNPEWVIVDKAKQD